MTQTKSRKPESLLDQWTTNPNLSPHSIRHYRQVLAKFHAAVDNKAWRDVTATDIGKYLEGFDNPKTKKTYLGVIKVFLNWMYDRDDKDLPRAIHKLTMKDAMRKHRKLQADELLTHDEVLQIVDACRSLHHKAFIMLLYGTGARVSELLNARVRDVIEVQGQTAIRTNGKEGEHNYFVSNTSLPMLRQYLASLGNVDPDTSLLNMTYKPAFDAIRRALKHTSITKRVTPHLFRHMRNTFLVKTVGKDKAKRIMGYSASSSVIDSYTHLTENDTVDAFFESEGKPLPEREQIAVPSAPETIMCPRCSFDNLSDSAFCARCTLPLGDHVAETRLTLTERLDKLEDLIMKQFLAQGDQERWDAEMDLQIAIRDDADAPELPNGVKFGVATVKSKRKPKRKH